MSKEVSKQIEETVEAVEEVKDEVTEVVAPEKESEVTIEVVNEKKSFGEKTADFIAKYRKPALRFLTGVALGTLAASIYNAAKQQDEDDDVIEGDFETFDDED